MSVTAEEARRVGDELHIDWSVVPPEIFRQALSLELVEHTDVTKGDLTMTGKIVLAHLREIPDYYQRAIPMEQAAELYWSARPKPSPVTGVSLRTGGGLSAKWGLVLAVIILVILVAIWCAWSAGHREGLLYRPFTDAAGHVIPVPGDPDRNILRRSVPYPLGQYPYGGLSSYYFSSDPARYSSYENDYCDVDPAACPGFRLRPFQAGR